MKVLVVGRAFMSRASRGGFIYMHGGVLEPVGERPISCICRKMLGNFI